jgi:hypothetical protein
LTTLPWEDPTCSDIAIHVVHDGMKRVGSRWTGHASRRHSVRASARATRTRRRTSGTFRGDDDDGFSNGQLFLSKRHRIDGDELGLRVAAIAASDPEDPCPYDAEPFD